MMDELLEEHGLVDKSIRRNGSRLRVMSMVNVGGIWELVYV